MQSTRSCRNGKGVGHRLAYALTFALLLSPMTVHPTNQVMTSKIVGTPPADVAKLIDLARKGQEATAKIPTLDPSDDEAQADYDPPGMPKLPIGCGAGGEEAEALDCQACYREAHEELNKLRRYFEQLRAVYVETDDFTKAAIAFGDGVAGSTGVAALEWNHQRGRITGSFKQFRAAYAAKYEELLARLEAVLHQIGNCEAQHFGHEDWYNRYGFMFQTFMSMHYAR